VDALDKLSSSVSTNNSSRHTKMNASLNLLDHAKAEKLSLVTISVTNIN